MITIPELLAPAGTPEALSAAIAAGADAVYFGARAYNARMGAGNFEPEEVRAAVSLCHAHGVRAHVTLNTQLYDRELDDALRCAERLYSDGVDALIVADLGAARLIHEHFPEMELHASTQCSGCSVRDAEYFASLGFSRMVCARELSADNVRALAEGSPIEIEMFVHGAVCVSVSGQCLYSSLVGGRSGNRGECAQPCRLPYGDGYPLSPKDLCLAGHIRQIIDTGVASLKIEGRMKSPDYVYRVTSQYRRLLDERRNADENDMRAFASAFSRSGFTDAYFTRAVKARPNDMLGIRTEADKNETRATETAVPEPEKVGIARIAAKFSLGCASVLSLTVGEKTVTVTADAPGAARTMPMTAGSVRERLSKLGGTPFCVTDATEFEIEVGDGIIMPLSAINELRRRGVAALTEPVGRDRRLPDHPVPERGAMHAGSPAKTAEFLRAEQITPKARAYFDTIYLPLREYDGRADGFVMPAVVYDDEETEIRRMVRRAAESGATEVILANAGQRRLLDGTSLRITAGYRYNICNTESALAARDAGADIVTVSPETTARQIADIAEHVRTSVIVYGRIPLMVTERCIIRAVSGDKCICGSTPVMLKDRRGTEFPMFGDGCRTVIYNSVPVYMADRGKTLEQMGCGAHHFIFTTESGDEAEAVIDAYERGDGTALPMRRIR